jgi:hypothetical protein
VPLPRTGVEANAAVATLERERLAATAPDGHFASLEQPQYFFDALHMNHAGRLRFTAALADYLSSTRKDPA